MKSGKEYTRLRRTSAVVGGIAVVLVLGRAVNALAISVAPHALFLSDDQLTTQLTLFNGSERAEEVMIEFAFGYPQGREDGSVGVALTDSPAMGEPSAHSWLRAFPRRVRVEPGQRQIVRIQATPPQGLDDGEFWARAIVTSQPAPSLPSPDTVLSMGLTFVFRNVLSVNFRHGDVSTGVDFDSLWVEQYADSVHAWIDLNRTGNAAFLGTLIAELTSADGVVVWRRPPSSVAVYRQLKRLYNLDFSDVPPGSYRLTVRVSTFREDIDERHVLPAPAVERFVDIIVP